MLIEADALSKSYGNIEVVRNVSFSLNQGEILGFLGPNGAGKTTVMRMLSGYHNPDSGMVIINGITLDDNTPELKNLIGYMPETVPLYGDMTPEEYLLFIADLRLIPKDEKKEKVENTLKDSGLDKRRQQRIETLSRGYRQRVGLAQALLHNPPVLILDEPLTGLDPNQIIEFRNLIRKISPKKAIIFSTHILQEVESICTRYIVINEGEIAGQGLVENANLEEVFRRATGVNDD